MIMVTWRSVYSLAARFHSGCLPQLDPDAYEDWPFGEDADFRTG
jgi:hypothetical protein